MMVSPPGSPEGVLRRRPSSVSSPVSAETSRRSRPQSMMYRPSSRSSRPSISGIPEGSRQENASRTSDDDGRTSVKVVIRVRPPLGPSDPGFENIPQRFQRSMVQVTTPSSLGVDSPQGRKLFIFDRVFAEDVTQRGIWDYIQDSVTSFIQGYNVSIMAYGQSGSGKSYTMGTSGPKEQSDPSAMGIIPRAASLLFESLQGPPSGPTHQNSGMKTPTRYSVHNMTTGVLQNGSLQNQPKVGKDKDWQLTATYVEIYNEQLRDLLLPESAPAHERSNVTVREDVKGRILLIGLQSVPINCVEDMLAALNHGSTIRQTDATAINAKSSRSHAIFSLNLIQRKSPGSSTSGKERRGSVPIEAIASADSTMMVESKLHFVDLAGSERLKNTGASGDRAKEGISINSGLASLGKVISQLSSRQSGSHVSYRDSKLTRLLQDSLGGNAITYMIACVTPAEFHLSETLNTVSYAQRARAIQSKPQIQQISDDADKQAMIDRLRAEVAFLRQQIRSAEGGERQSSVAPERIGRQNEREVELQNHLLDVQESYSTLSQRHAKLISGLTNRDDRDGTSAPVNLSGESASDRLNRSRANQEQIEQVVLEYETTIQSLEASLSTTRSSLSNTESNLMERETKCAYVETVNQQLHARLTKLMDREANNDIYLRDLEAKLDGQSSGEEKTGAVMTELRREIARIRETETNAEDYISTLEERLAEADQDMELMQREVERLEHVVERQRSLGKLDNLLFELDHIQQSGTKTADEASQSRALSPLDSVAEEGNQNALETLREAEETALPQLEDDDELETTPHNDEPQVEINQNDGLEDLQRAVVFDHRTTTSNARLSEDRDASDTNPSQTMFMAEKFETVNQELVSLRLEHESTVSDLDLVSAKYQQALHTLAQMQADMQDVADETHRPTRGIASPDRDSQDSSFLEDARMNDLVNGGHLSSSRSLSSELSLAGESPATTDTSDITPVSKQIRHSEISASEIDRLQQLLAEHEHGMKTMADQYAQLQSEHQNTLISVEELRAEVQKSKTIPPPSPVNGRMPSMMRRSTQNVPGADRGQRSITSLRTIIAEDFEGRSEKLESYDVHLNAATHELQSRLDRIQVLEVDNKNIKKEMETKTTIISGLTRERNSIKAPAQADLSVVNQMRDQVMQSENEARALRAEHEIRVGELQTEIRGLKDRIKSHGSAASSPTPSGTDDQSMRELQFKLAQLEDKHQLALQALQEFERRHFATIAELEAATATIQTLQTQQSGNQDGSAFERAASATAMQREREKHDELIEELKRQLDDHRNTISANAKKIGDLEHQNSAARETGEQHATGLESKTRELSVHKEHINKLQQDLTEEKSAVEFHKHGLKSLHEAHANTMEELKLAHAGAMAEIDDQLAELQTRHDQVVKSLKSDAERPRLDLANIMGAAGTALGHPTTPDMLANHIRDLAEEKKHIVEANSRLTGANAELERQLSSKHGSISFDKDMTEANDKVAKHQETIRRLANEVADHEEALREKEDMIRKRDGTIQVIQDEVRNKSRMVEELEQQIESTFDQHHNRMSILTAQGNEVLVEAKARIAALEKELEGLRNGAETDAASRTDTMKSARPHSPPNDIQGRSNSITSNLRKSASVASLPSPPPAIPLPPLPALPSISVNTVGMPAGPASPTVPRGQSPTQSRHTSKELSSAPVRDQTQLVEDLEGRVRTIEKHLHAEKQLTATLEEALVDLETQSNKIRSDSENWKKKAWSAEEELSGLRKERRSERLSVQAVEEEKNKRKEAEAARAHLEERMQALSRKKKKNALNCF